MGRGFSARQYYFHFLTYFWTGCRAGELLELRHCDFNFFKGTVFIDGTKTKTSSRTIPMFRPFASEIFSIIKQGSKEKVFTVTDNYLRMELRKILLALGIAKPNEIADNDEDTAKYSLKSTRHSFATRRKEDGCDMKQISQWMGHTNLAMTDNYSHIMDEFEQQQAEKVNALYA